MRSSVVVWGAWGALTLAGLAFVAAYGRNCPLMDEWGMLPALAGDENAAAWAMSPHHEHWYTVPRLLYLALFRSTGDLRLGMATSLLLLAAAAALMILAAGRLRGRTSVADVFFPLAFLHAGHWEQVLMSYQVCFTLAVALGAGLACLASLPGGATWGRVALATAATLLLVGTGAAGAVFSLAGGAWLVVIGCDLARQGLRRRAAAAFAGAACLFSLLALIAAAHPGSPDVPMRRAADMFGFALRLAAFSFGPSHPYLWPLQVAAVGAGGCFALRAAAGRRSAQTAGLWAAVMSTVVLVVVLSWGRGWAGPEVVAVRYTALLLPGLSAVYLITVGFAGGWERRAVPAVFAGLALIAWPLNLSPGLLGAVRTSEHMDCMAEELTDGLPADLIGEHHDWQVLLTFPGVGKYFDDAARIGFGPFRNRARTELVCASHAVQHDPDDLRPRLPDEPDMVAVRVRGEYVPKLLRMADYRVRWRETGSDVLHEEKFQVIKSGPASVLVRVRGAPTDFEIAPDHGEGRYRIISIDVVSKAPVATRPNARR